MQKQTTRTKRDLSRGPARKGMTRLRFLDLAMRDPDLTEKEFRLLAALALFATWRPGTEGADCFPSQKTLGRRIGGRSRGWVIRRLKTLAGKGWVVSHRRERPNGSRTSNLYQLAVPRNADPDGRGWLGHGPGQGGCVSHGETPLPELQEV